jgi:hypothetical protein
MHSADALFMWLPSCTIWRTRSVKGSSTGIKKPERAVVAQAEHLSVCFDSHLEIARCPAPTWLWALGMGSWSRGDAVTHHGRVHAYIDAISVSGDALSPVRA